MQPKIADFAPFALTASAVALQLALGVPVLVGAYSRSAYAAVVSNCTSTPSGNIGGNTSIDCSIGSGTTGDAQLFYSGVNIWQTARNISFPGLAMNCRTPPRSTCPAP